MWHLLLYPKKQGHLKVLIEGITNKSSYKTCINYTLNSHDNNRISIFHTINSICIDVDTMKIFFLLPFLLILFF